jgi:hypothetical protein
MFDPKSGYVGISGGQSGNKAGSLRALRFPLPILIPPAAPYSSPPYNLDADSVAKQQKQKKDTWYILNCNFDISGSVMKHEVTCEH